MPPVIPTANASTSNSIRIDKMPGDHDLQSSWSFWYDRKQNKKIGHDAMDFRGQLQKLATFETVEGFWKIFCYLKRPSALEINVNLYLFRGGPNIVPMWEAFPRGGRYHNVCFLHVFVTDL